MVGKGRPDTPYSFGPFVAAQPVRLQIRRRILWGANPYSRYSIAYLEIAGSNIRARSLDSLQRLAAELGLPALADLKGEPPIGRSIDAVVDGLRGELDLPPVSIDRPNLPADASVVPLDPEKLNQPLVDVAVAIASEGTDFGELRYKLDTVKSAAESFFDHIHMKALGEECRRRGIPWRRLDWSRHLHQIGEGSHQLRIDLTVSSRTGRIPTSIAADKAETNRLLARYGIPVAKQLVVRSTDTAWAAAQKIGLPVVVKPRFGRKGVGVSVRLSDRREIEAAVREALKLDSSAVMESYVAGLDHRVLVAPGKIIAIAKRLPAHVMGDGQRTVRELVEIENRNPHRSKAHKMTVLKTIELDSEMTRRLASQGLDLDSVPPADRPIWLRFGGNLSTGATAEDVTDRIHPENAKMLLRAVELVGLDIAGIDFLTSDIAKPYAEVGAAICEINSRVATRAHMAAELGTGRSVVGRLLEAIYTAPRGGRLPVVVLLGCDDESIADTLAARIGRDHQLHVAVASSRRLAIDGEVLPVRPRSLGLAHGLIVEHPSVDFVILEADPQAVEAEGLGVSSADLIVDGGGFASHAPLRSVLEKSRATIAQWSNADEFMDRLRASGLL